MIVRKLRSLQLALALVVGLSPALASAGNPQVVRPGTEGIPRVSSAARSRTPSPQQQRLVRTPDGRVVERSNAGATTVRPGAVRPGHSAYTQTTTPRAPQKQVHFGKPQVQYFYQNRPANQQFTKQPSSHATAGTSRPNTRPRALQTYKESRIEPRRVTTPRQVAAPHQATTPRRVTAPSTSRQIAARTAPSAVARTRVPAKVKSPYRGAGAGLAIAGGAVVTGTAIDAIARQNNRDVALRTGQMSRSQYNQAVATDAARTTANTALELYKLKKFSPSTIVSNELIGTDPVGFGADAVGDIINGTNNTERNLQNVERKLKGHVDGVKMLVNDPNKWAKTTERNAQRAVKNVERDVNKTVKDVEKAGKDVGKFIGGIFGP